MTPEDFLSEAGRRLIGARYAVERSDLRGAPAVVGRRRPFRVQWVMTQLKMTVVVCTVETVSYGGWYAFLSDAFRLASAYPKGLPTGLQSGIGAVPVLAAQHVDPAAAVVAANEKPRVELFKGMSMPALIDLTNRHVYAYEGGQFVGAIYVPFLRKQRNLVTNIVREQ